MAKKTPKTKVLSVRLPIEEHETVEKAAALAGASVSAYVAQLLKSPGKSKAPAPETAKPAPVIAMPVLADDAVMGELRRIGININQIARATNAGLPPDLALFARSMGLLLDALADPTEFKRRLGMVKARFPTPLQVASALVQTATPNPEPKSVTPTRPTVPPHLVDEIQKALATQPAAPKPPRASEPPRYDAVTVTPTPPPPSREPASYPPYQGQPTAPRDAPPIRAKPGRPPARRPRPALLPTPPASPVLPTPKRTPTGLSHDHTHPQARHQLQDRHRLHPSRPEQGVEGPGRLGILGKLWKW